MEKSVFFGTCKVQNNLKHAVNVKVCLTSEDAFVITCVANVMEVKVLYVQQDLRYEISSYWRLCLTISNQPEQNTRDIYICIKYRYKPLFNKYCHIRESVVGRID
jgi:hypothetical protein